MSARIYRSGWRRRRKGVRTIKLFDYDLAAGLNELDMNFIEWFTGRSRDELTGIEELYVKLIGLDEASVALLPRVKHVKIDELFYSVSGERSPLGTDAKPDYLLRCDVRGVARV